MMVIPKIVAVQAINDRTLMIEFSNHEFKQYEITHLLEKSLFKPLAHPAFFKNFQIEPGGHALVWNEDIDLSEYELWRNGVSCAQETDGRTSHTAIASTQLPAQSL